MNTFCLSCAAPLDLPDFKGPAESFCKHCTDEQGTVKRRADVQSGVAEWFLMWHPGVDKDTAMSRADIYLQAMPHWAD